MPLHISHTPLAATPGKGSSSANVRAVYAGAANSVVSIKARMSSGTATGTGFLIDGRDTIVTNDPWLATGHLPDFTVVTGIFHRGRLVGFSGSISHSPDVGGALWSADCREIFE